MATALLLTASLGVAPAYAEEPAEQTGAQNAQALAPGTTFTRVLQQSATLKGQLYFIADDGARGLELWRSNGTAAGTALVQDLTPGSGSSFSASETVQIAATDAWLYVRANGKLYRTSGTSGLTLINTGGHAPSSLAAAGSTLFVHHSSGTVDTHRLYRVADASAQYQQVRAINRISGLTTAGSHAYFSASETGNDFELWRSDGSAAGTVRVADAIPGTAQGVDPHSITAVGNRVYFTGRTATSPLSQLWTSDGTATGTRMLTNFTNAPLTSAFINSSFQAVGNTLYFTATTAKHGHELYTAVGTKVSLVKDLTPGTASSRISHLTAFGSRLAFYLGDSEGRGKASQEKSLWVSNGTAKGTARFHSESQGSLLNGAVAQDLPIVVVNGRLHFMTRGDYSSGMFVHGKGYRLWRSQGTAASTFQVAARSSVRAPLFIGAAGSRILYIAPSSTAAGLKGTAQFYDTSTKPASIKRLKSPRIVGTVAVSSAFSRSVKAHPGRWSRGSVSYRWLKSGKESGTARSIALSPADAGKKLVLEVRVRSVGAPDVVFRTKAKRVLRTFSTLSSPSIIGTVKVGRTLTASKPNLTPRPSKIRYQWYANGKKIKRADKRSFVVKAAHRGKKISVRATATKKNYLAHTTRSKTKRVR
ncbi:hypothetical protein J4H92_01770 [Leucobacter weissii]|uniref:ELWxxDGT repeat-containing protein n=1 Tax=Leucobacter weissii TaxID=1983706 RepID=A0A939SAR7_9MICO|nr:hypothetical protein [Leucobacter weissii]